MPLDDDDDDQQITPKKGLKNISSQKSIFDGMEKKPTQEDFENNVKAVQEKVSQYRTKTADLAIQFYKTMALKTLVQNKNTFQKDIENDLIRDMVKLAQQINEDPGERESEGSVGWIAVLLKTCLNQRDKINELEYSVAQLKKITSVENISRIIVETIDSNKKSG